MMSDLHFDPMADPKLVNRLAAAEPGQWRAVLESSDDTSLGQYGRDSNWMLLRSALRQMAETLPNPVFVIVSGDFLAHGFRRTFDAAASDHSDAAYRVFVRKTMQFLAQQLRQSFPAAPILPALGNNDDVCGDYQLQPGGPFLADALPILHTLLGGDATGIDQNWTSYGNYSMAVGGVTVRSRRIPISSRSITVMPAARRATPTRDERRSLGSRPSWPQQDRRKSPSGWCITYRRGSTAMRPFAKGPAPTV